MKNTGPTYLYTLSNWRREKSVAKTVIIFGYLFQLTGPDINSRVAITVYQNSRTVWWPARGVVDNRYEAAGDPREDRDMYFQKRRARAHPRLKSFVCIRCLSSGIFTV